METIEAKEFKTYFKQKKNKYNAKKCTIRNENFDSISEGEYWLGLMEQKENGLIKEVQRQVKESLKGENGTHIFNYYVDFLVIHNNGVREYIEHKGISTDLFKAKWKMLLDKYKKEIEKGEIICNINWYKSKYKYSCNLNKYKYPLKLNKSNLKTKK
jgi:hypothetical protein